MRDAFDILLPKVSEVKIEMIRRSKKTLFQRIMFHKVEMIVQQLIFEILKRSLICLLRIIHIVGTANTVRFRDISNESRSLQCCLD